MNITMNITLTNMCLVYSIQKNPSTMVDNEWRSSCHHACQLFLWEISVGWIMVTSTRLPALCAGEAPDKKLQINQLGPNMIGSRAESQLHIHSINKCNDPNLACADYLPSIVWPAKLVYIYIYVSQARYILFCSIDCFRFMSHSQYWKRLMLLNGMSLDCEANMAFISILPVRFTLDKAISSWMWFRRHWFPYGKGILTHHPSSWILRNETIRHCFNKKKTMRKV